MLRSRTPEDANTMLKPLGTAEDPALEHLVGKPVGSAPGEPNLRSGEHYRESLRDRRVVILNGREVADVTSEPTLRRGIDTMARYYDAQLDAESQEALTTVDPDTGERFSTAWLVPRSVADLRRYDTLIRHSTYQTFGVFGRPPDYGPVKAISFIAWNHLICGNEPDALARMTRFIEIGRRNNLLSADVIIDVQANRKLPIPERPSRLRVVEERRDGVVLTGAKAGSSVFSQGNIGTISMPPPHPTMPEECAIWAAIPANAPGLRMILREPLTTGSENAEDHPLDAMGEESDALLLFDRVFVPWENVFSYKNKAVIGIYTTLGQFAFWKIATRLSYRAQIFAGAAQMIVEALGTEGIPAVRAMVADVISYAATLRGMMEAAVESAQPTESGVYLPNHVYVTAGRLFALDHYPRIMQLLRDLSGQGLISRVPQATWERADVGAILDEYLPGNGLGARDKNRLFNLVWDMTCSPHAMRVALFENLNATPAPALREELYRVYDRSPGMAAIRRQAGID